MNTHFRNQRKTATIYSLALAVAIASGSVFANVTVDCTSTATIQSSLNTCSTNNDTCEIPSGTTCVATGPLYLWGGASLVSSNGGGIEFNQSSVNRYLFNLGLSGAQNPSTPTSNLANTFTGKISGVTFSLAGSANYAVDDGGGRVLSLWRTDGAVIDGNTFNVGGYRYSATFSGNDNY